MSITCCIRYEIDPFQKDAFGQEGARKSAWAQEKSFILREERAFAHNVKGTINRPSEV